MSIAGQYIWFISQNIDENHLLEFSKRVFWRPAIWSTVGEYRWSEWYGGEYTQRTFSRANIPMEWLVDDCWTHAYSNDHSGHMIKGSLDLLLQAVLGGKRVRVQMNSYIIDADNLNIRNGHISTQPLGQLSLLSLYDFSTNVYLTYNR